MYLQQAISLSLGKALSLRKALSLGKVCPSGRLVPGKALSLKKVCPLGKICPLGKACPWGRLVSGKGLSLEKEGINIFKFYFLLLFFCFTWIQSNFIGNVFLLSFCYRIIGCFPLSVWWENANPSSVLWDGFCHTMSGVLQQAFICIRFLNINVGGSIPLWAVLALGRWSWAVEEN